MNKFEKVKQYYEKGLWDESRLQNAVRKGWISEEEFGQIVKSLRNDSEAVVL